jgi:phospholipase/carboxylesterase
MGDPIYQGADASAAQAICLVVHGRGQNQQDMLDMIVNRLALPFVRFVLPKSAGHGWYDARAIDPLTDQTLIQMHDAVHQIADLIQSERASAADLPLLLCGFSQGACLSVELLMCQPDLVDAACLFTACRIGAETDDLPVKNLQGKKIYTSCGDNDPWIPATAHHRMIGDLTRAGGRVRADMFPGRPHDVTDTEIAALADMLRALASGQPIWGESP